MDELYGGLTIIPAQSGQLRSDNLHVLGAVPRLPRRL
jgi:hypothetical protein